MRDGGRDVVMVRQHKRVSVEDGDKDCHNICSLHLISGPRGVVIVHDGHCDRACGASKE